MTASPRNITQSTSSTVDVVREKARLLRIYSMEMTTAAGSGHPTSCLSCAELMAATFFHAMRFDPKNPNAIEGDRFVLSKGHAAPILYAALAEAGVFPVSRLMTLRQLNSELEGHPTPLIPGVDAATGSLGQGLSVAAGLAMGARAAGSDARIYALTGDGELAEGSIWEAAAFAAFEGIENLTVMCDINALGQSGPTMYRHDMEVYRQKFESEGWHVEVINGHDAAAVIGALDRARTIPNRPQAILARTDKGHGVSFVCGKEGWHGKPFSKEQLAQALAEMGPIPPIVPDDGKSYARKNLPEPPDFPAPEAPNYAMGQEIATREAYGIALEKLAKVNPKVVAIDGDVKNSTFSETIEKTDPKRLIEGYIAEQNMIGVALGLEAQGIVPFAATFACFLTRAFDQARMSAVSRATINFCGSHCGVSIGEDGPSQMGLEDIAMFRTIPESVVFYPADGVAAERLTELAARTPHICYIRTSRPKTKTIYANDYKFSAPGYKVVRQATNEIATVIGAGVTLYEALKAADTLASQGKSVRLIDLYCVKPIDGAKLGAEIKATGGKLIVVEDHYPQGGIGEAVLSALAEAGALPTKFKHLAVPRVPHSGKADELLEKFGISANHIVAAVNAL
jgi:transketolase